MSFKDITRGIVTAIAVFTITLIIPGASFAFLGLTGFAAFAALAGTVAALSFIQRKIAPEPSFEQQEVKSIVTGESIEPRYIFGRAKTGGHLVSYEEWKASDDPRISGGDRSARWIIVLGEGELVGLERLWVNGKEMPINPPLRNDGARYFVPGDLISYSPSLLNEWIEDARNDLILYAKEGETTTSDVEALETHLQSLIDRRDNYRWTADRSGSKPTDMFAAMLVYGGEPPTDGSAPPPHAYTQTGHRLWAPNSRWTNSHRLYGKTYMVCSATEYGNRGNWIEQGGSTGGAQIVQALVRGIKVSTPNSTEPVWTENAAAIRHHWHTEILGASEDQIDQDSYRAAFQVCDERVVIPEVEDTDNDIANRIREASLPQADNSHPTTVAARSKVISVWNRRYAGVGEFEGSRKDQLRYSINGIITGSEIKRNPKAVEDAMDVAFAGSVVDTGSKLVFRPGVNRSAQFTIDQDDIVDSAPAVQIDGTLQQKATSLELSLISSARHNWDDYQLPRITDHVAVEREGADFVQQRGNLRFVVYPQTAQRLAHIALREASENRIVDVSVNAMEGVREGEPKFINMLPSDVVTLDMPSIGFTGEQATVHVLGDGLDGRLALNLVERPANLYDDTFNYPIGFASGGVEYIPAPDPLDFIPVSQQGSSSLAGIRFSFPPQINGRDVQYRWVSFGAETQRLFDYNRAVTSPVSIVPFGDNPTPATSPAGVYRVSARYVVRSGDDLQYPLSLWSDEYDGGMLWFDAAGFYMAGRFRSSTLRLPRQVFVVGASLSADATYYRDPVYTELDTDQPHLQSFEFLQRRVIPGQIVAQEWQYLSPIISDTAFNSPTDFSGTHQFFGGVESIRWTMRVLEQPAGGDAALQQS